MRQYSETNIIVLNTALKYKIQRNTQKHIYTKYKPWFDATNPALVTL